MFKSQKHSLNFIAGDWEIKPDTKGMQKNEVILT